ncbi:EG45-like domain containing protein [Prosopis cineraria]|uniref:EG45-like domain containing protein n=1 Tax=Prosopis cineraria TaxID=364024 RepID=UPI00240FDCDF|nr:EG45-like domain containing protein [Prosopis cineraria]
MALKLNVVLVISLAIASLVYVASASSGTATFYTKLRPSACFESHDEGTMVAAASDSIWDHGKACGRKYRVRYTGGTSGGLAHPCRSRTVTVKIVDFCPRCQGTIDLSHQAFSAIADPVEGKIRIDFTQ